MSLSDVNAMRRPSGDQDGYQLLAELLVRRATFDPSGFIVCIPAFDMNAMRHPLGDQDGRYPLARRRAPPDPSVFIVYIAVFPSLSEENAMRPPSGDQDIPELKGMELLVSSASPEPSALITHIP